VLAFLGFANGLVPWALRNQQATGDAVPIVDSAYLHLWIGNNPKATGGPQTEAELLQGLAESRGEPAGDVLRSMGELPQKHRYGRLAHDVLRQVETDAGGTLKRRLWAGLCFVFGEDWLTKRVLAREAESPGE